MISLALALVVTLLSAAYATGEEAPLAPVIVRDVVVDTQPPGTVIWIKTSRPPRFVAALIDTPPRLVIDLTEATFGWSQGRLPVRSSDVKEVRGSQFRKGVARVVIELVRHTSYTIEPGLGGLRVAIGRAPNQARQESRPGVTIAPARPSAEAAAPSGDRPRLQGVVIRETGAVAYIQNPRTNGVAGYRIGDAFGASILETIEEDRVVLRGPNDTIELRIAPLPRNKP